MNSVVLSGILLGLSAGFAPGPLMALVLAQTLRHGTHEGCKAALVPLVTDVPVILLALLMTTALAHLQMFLGVVSLAGGCFVLHLAWDSFRPPRMNPEGAAVQPQTWRKGIVTHLLNPNPWLFWFTVGAATLTKATAAGWLHAVGFLGIFYALLCGTKVAIALFVGTSRSFLSGPMYRRILAALGVALVVFAALLFRDAFLYFGIALGGDAAPALPLN